MSNRVTIQPTVFENHPSGEKTFGIRIYDDYDNDYNNMWSWEDLNLAPLDILRKVRDGASEKAEGFLDFVVENQMGIGIGDDWYPWERIREVFEGW